MSRLRTAKRRIALALVLALLPVCGCTVWSDPASSVQEQPISSREEVSSGRTPGDKPAWEEVSSRNMFPNQVNTAVPQAQTPFECAKMRQEYEKLPNQATRQAYDAMLEAVSTITSSRNERGEYRTAGVFLEGIRLSERELRLALSAMRSDNPQIFWIANRFGYDNGGRGTVVELYSYYSAKECGQRIQKLAQAVRKMCAVLDRKQPVFNRELALHDALLASVAYDKEAVGSAEDPEPFTAYGALVEGKAVCQGYALAMKLLLCYAGIESTVISGASQGVAHAWNAVLLDGEWYYLDATWNDTEQHIRYDYFNVSSEVLQVDHTIDPVYPEGDGGEQYNLWVPECTAVALNYFNRCAVYLNGFDEENDQRLLARLQNMLAGGSTMLTVRFDPSMDYEESVSMLITEQPYKLVYLMRRANQSSGSVNRFVTEDIQYTRAKNQNAVTVWLSLKPFPEP